MSEPVLDHRAREIGGNKDTHTHWPSRARIAHPFPAQSEHTQGLGEQDDLSCGHYVIKVNTSQLLLYIPSRCQAIR